MQEGTQVQDLLDALENVSNEYHGLYEFLDQLADKDQASGLELKEMFLPLTEDALRIALTCRSEVDSKARIDDAHTKLELNRLAQQLDNLSTSLQSRITPYLSYSDAMARRRADLEKFAREMTGTFIQGLLDAIADYFDTKENQLVSLIEKEFDLAERAKDAFVRSPAKVAAKGVKAATDLAGKFVKKPIPGVPTPPEPDTFLERIIKDGLTASLQKDLSGLIVKRIEAFKEEWRRKISGESPDLQFAFAAPNDHASTTVGPELDVSLQALGTGLGASAAAVAGLAAGWHTLEYALAHVFPPAGVITAVITGAVMLATQEKSKRDKEERVKKVIRQVHQEVLQALLSKGLIRAVHRACDQCVEGVVEAWEKAISGRLLLDDYRQLSARLSSFLAALKTASTELKKVSMT